MMQTSQIGHPSDFVQTDTPAPGDTILVLGLGNPLLGDDSLGWRVVETLQPECDSPAGAVEVDCLAVGGLRLMERMIGYRAVVLVDAITTGQRPTGSLICCTLDDLPDLSAGHHNSVHDTSLQSALEVGKMLGVSLPDVVWVIGVEIEPTFEFSEALSPTVGEAVVPAREMVMDILRKLNKETL